MVVRRWRLYPPRPRLGVTLRQCPTIDQGFLPALVASHGRKSQACLADRWRNTCGQGRHNRVPHAQDPVNCRSRWIAPSDAILILVSQTLPCRAPCRTWGGGGSNLASAACPRLIDWPAIQCGLKPGLPQRTAPPAKCLPICKPALRHACPQPAARRSIYKPARPPRIWCCRLVRPWLPGVRRDRIGVFGYRQAVHQDPPRSFQRRCAQRHRHDRAIYARPCGAPCSIRPGPKADQ